MDSTIIGLLVVLWIVICVVLIGVIAAFMEYDEEAPLFVFFAIFWPVVLASLPLIAILYLSYRLAEHLKR